MHDNNACHKAKTLAVANFLVQHSIGVKDIVHEHLTLTAGTFEVRVLGKGPSQVYFDHMTVFGLLVAELVVLFHGESCTVEVWSVACVVATNEVLPHLAAQRGGNAYSQGCLYDIIAALGCL